MGLSYIRLNRHFIVGETMLKDGLLAKAIGVQWVSETGVGFVGKARVSVSVSEVGRNSTVGVEESWVSFGLSLPLADVVASYAGCVGVAEGSVAEVVEPGVTGESTVESVVKIGIGGPLGLGIGLPLSDQTVGGGDRREGGISDGGEGRVDTVAVAEGAVAPGVVRLVEKRVGFRLGHCGGGEGENYEQLHGEC